MANDPALAAVVDVITTHVAGSLEENTPTPAVAIALGKPLWQVCGRLAGQRQGGLAAWHPRPPRALQAGRGAHRDA